MTEFVNASITLTRIDLAGGEPGPDVPAHLDWDSGEPLVVGLVFNPHTVERRTWEFSRDLLTAGVIRPAGEGDVRVLPLRGRIGIAIRSDEGQAAFSVSRDDVEAFLRATLAVVPDGQEFACLDWSELDAWLGQEGAPT